MESEPEWLQRVANVFPVSHLVRAFSACLSPYTTGSGFSAHDLLSLLAWGAIGTVVAVRRFATEETDEAASRRRHVLHRAAPAGPARRRSTAAGGDEA